MEAVSKSSYNIYFANREAKDCAHALLQKGQSFYNVLRANFYLDKLANQWRAYHGQYSSGYDRTDHTLQFTGEQGELSIIPVNHYRNIADHIIRIILANRPVMQAKAVNTDYKSLSQTYLCNSILEYYMRERGLENYLAQAVEYSVVLGAGFIEMEWNASAGEDYDVNPENGDITKEGEVVFSLKAPFDVIFDGTKENWDHEWMVVREWVNRFNLVAQYPELEDKILAIPTKNNATNIRITIFTNDDTDDICVYKFYHKKTNAVPNGRYMLYLEDGTVIMDAAMPYRQIPVYRVAPASFLGTSYGYTPMFDIFPIQEAINAMYSTILTNNNAFGVQNLWVHPSDSFDVQSLAGGLNILKTETKPEPLQFTATAPETYKFLADLIQAAETISGVSGVTRGNPEASLRSGNALAMVQSMTLQFMSGLQQSYVKMVEDVGTGLVNILKDFATAPKIIALVGRNNRTFLKSFTGDSISAINRVIVDIGNPLASSTAGRVQMAEQLLQMGMLNNKEEYFSVMNTGRLDVAFEGEMKENLNIRSENEQLSDGKPAVANPLDRHRLHINEHRSIIADPDLRQDMDLVKNVQDHIMEHIRLLKETPPEVLALVGEQPLMSMMPPQDGSGAGQGAMPPDGSQGTPPSMGSILGEQQQANPIAPSVPNPPAPFQNAPSQAGQMIR